MSGDDRVKNQIGWGNIKRLEVDKRGRKMGNSGEGIVNF